MAIKYYNPTSAGRRAGSVIDYIRTYPVGTIPAAAGRGSSAQAEPGLRSGGTGTLRAFAR
jgi:hypothetical protein